MLYDANDDTVPRGKKRMLKKRKVTESNFEGLCLQLQVQVRAEFETLSVSEEEQGKMSPVLFQRLGALGTQ